MRIQLNLASEPFRRDRPMIVASAAVGMLLTALLVLLVVLAIAERNRAAESREALARVNRSLETLSREEAKLQGVLRRPENAEVLDRSLFLNALLHRKGLSWTRIFGDLEQVMPHNVRLMSVRPQISPANELQLDMWVAAQATEPVLQFIRNLEQSPQFGSTAVPNSLPPSQTEPNSRYRVSVKYAQKL